MKYTYVLFSFLMVFFYTYSFAQCGQGIPLYFDTQQEIDDFPMTHPGLTETNGNVTIKESIPGDITSLAGLNQLQKIDGCLYIRSNENLVDLTGLENLDRVSSRVRINDNPSLVSLSGLNGLRYISESFYVYRNNSLLDLTGLESLYRVLGQMEITDNPSLVNLNGVSDLKTVRRLIIKDNDALTALTGLESVARVEDYIEIRNNAMLSSLTGIDDLFSLASYRISITNNPNLTVCGVPSICRYAYDGLSFGLGGNGPGCNNRTEITDNCTVPFYPCLPDGVTFTSQEEIDSFKINYPNCWDIGGTVTITSPEINNVIGLNQVASIDGDFIIQNTSLSTLHQLNLRRINGELRLEGNFSLSNLNGLAYMNPNTMTNLVIQYNTSLASGCALSNFCYYISANLGAFNIGINSSGCNSGQEILGNCSLLPINLTSFTANIRNKAAVLHWQTATETNNEGFEIQKSRDGVNWEKTGWQAGQGNTAEAQSYTYIDENPFFGVSYYRLKQVDFDGNFEYSEMVNIEYKGKFTISLYPNPAEDILYIADLDGQNIQEIKLYNQAGQSIPVNMKTSNSINTSQLTPGIYMLKIMINEEVFFEKFVVK